MIIAYQAGAKNRKCFVVKTNRNFMKLFSCMIFEKFTILIFKQA